MSSGWAGKPYTARHEFVCLCGGMVLPGDRLGWVRIAGRDRHRCCHYACAVKASAAWAQRGTDDDHLARFDRRYGKPERQVTALPGVRCSRCGRTFTTGEVIDLRRRRGGKTPHYAPTCHGGCQIGGAIDR